MPPLPARAQANNWILGLAFLYVNPPTSMTLGAATYPENWNDTAKYPVTSTALVSEVCSNAGGNETPGTGANTCTYT